MEESPLYVGLDSTQYSNSLFHESSTSEICVAVFSRDRECIKHGNCIKKRDFSILEEILKGKNSASITLSPNDTPGNIRPLIHSAVELTEFYIKEVLKKYPGFLEVHIDGPLYAEDKRYIKSSLGIFGHVKIDYYKKCCRKRGYVLKKGKKAEYCTQPRIVLAADALSNYLFKKKGRELLLDKDSRNSRLMRLPINGNTVEHYHLSK